MTETPVFYDPVAGNVSLEFECSESWEEMPGSGRKKHCAACKRNVYELASYTSTEVDELLERGACRPAVYAPLAGGGKARSGIDAEPRQHPSRLPGVPHEEPPIVHPAMKASTELWQSMGL